MLERVLKASEKNQQSCMRRSVKRSREETELRSEKPTTIVSPKIELNAKDHTNSTTTNDPETSCIKNNDIDHNEFNDDMDFSMLEDDENQFSNDESTAEKANELIKTGKIKEDLNESYANVLLNWEKNCKVDNNVDDDDELLSTIDVDAFDEQTTMKFWYLDAYEDPFKFPGKVFLFGRMPVETNVKEFKSVCVTVENVDRSLYLLPREYVRLLLFHWL